MKGSGDAMCEDNAIYKVILQHYWSEMKVKCKTLRTSLGFLSPITSLTRLGVDMESRKVCPSFLFVN